MAPRLRWAKLMQSACLEDIDTTTLRGLQADQWGQDTVQSVVHFNLKNWTGTY